MKAWVIDDERPAIKVIKKLLEDFPAVTVSGEYTDALAALENIKIEKPDLVFLDIEMPNINGIQAAETILELAPGIDIIFVTAYNRYAVEAFELNALDYLLKPVSGERFNKTMVRLVERRREKNTPVMNGTIVINSFGCLEVVRLNEGREVMKWRSDKTRELFAFLLHHQGKTLIKEKIIDTLWPEQDEKRAVHQLHNGIYYIRKNLEEFGVGPELIAVRGKYAMHLGEVYYDALAFRELLRQSPKVTGENIQQYEEVISKYRGDYLENEDYLWAREEREWLATLRHRAVLDMARYYLKSGNSQRAEELLMNLLKTDPYADDTNELLLSLYEQMGNLIKAKRHYDNYARLLKQDLGVEPGPMVMAVNERIQQ